MKKAFRKILLKRVAGKQYNNEELSFGYNENVLL